MLFQEEKTINFEQLPQAVAFLISEVQELKLFLKTNNSVQVEPSNKWFNLQELCEYLPDRPARQTVYGWIGQKLIPYHKKERNSSFLKVKLILGCLAINANQLQSLKQKRQSSWLKKGGL